MGQLAIINKDTISLKGNMIALKDIERIKCPRLIPGIVNTTMAAHGAGLVITAPILAGLNSSGRDQTKLMATQMAVGGALYGLSVAVKNLGRRHKDSRWTYQVVVVPEVN